MKLLNFFQPLFLATVAQSKSSDHYNTPPKNYGIVLFPTFTSLDVFGPLDALNALSRQRQLNLAIIAQTLDPISTKGHGAYLDKFNSSFGESIVPTHTFANAPKYLDVLIVPGGIGTLYGDRQPIVNYVKKAYPKSKYVLTICSGSHIVAEAGILDGRKATSNKRLWSRVGLVGPKVYWIAKARWIVDGNIWSSSGVSAGMDATFAFIREMYGDSVGRGIAVGMEYEAHEDPNWDPFAAIWNATDVFPVGA